MKKTLILVMLVSMAMMALPVMAAGPERQVLPQATPEVTVTSPLPTPTLVAQPTAAPTGESQPGFEIGDEDGRVVFGGTYTLRSSERLRGDLVVFGGIATLQSDTRVDGNVVLFGGTADIAGRIQGDLVLIGGVARLRSTAIVDGQVVRVGGALTQDQGAQIHEGESGGVTIPPIPPIPPIVPIPTRPRYWVEDLVGHSVSTIGTAFVLALLAVFVLALWREPVERVNRAITLSPGVSWVVGFLTVLTFAVVALPFIILSGILVLACGLGLIGFLLLFVVTLALTAAGVMGWIALGQLIGERLLTALGGRNMTMAASAAAGTAVISLLWLGLDPLCGLGWLFFLALAPLGLGAVVLTRFGTREYTPTNGTGSALTAPVAPSAPPAPPAPAAPEPPQPAPVEPVEPPAPGADAPLSSEPSVPLFDKPAVES